MFLSIGNSIFLMIPYDKWQSKYLKNRFFCSDIQIIRLQQLAHFITRQTQKFLTLDNINKVFLKWVK